MEHKCKKSDSKPIEKCELNREQIIKALECCIKVEYCATCPATDYCKGTDSLTENALALIKELTEEVVDLKDIAEGYQKQFEDCYAENERLHASCTELEQVCKKWQGRLNIECEYTRADTVRKMQERLKQAICDNTYPDFNKAGKPVNIWKATTGYDLIDQIAKEMLEGATHTNNANTCICCGAIIPEGVLTCPKCDQEREV